MCDGDQCGSSSRSKVAKSRWYQIEADIKSDHDKGEFGYIDADEFTGVLAFGEKPGPGHFETLNNRVHDGRLMGMFAKGLVSHPREQITEDLPHDLRLQNKYRDEAEFKNSIAAVQREPLARFEPAAKEVGVHYIREPGYQQGKPVCGQTV